MNFRQSKYRALLWLAGGLLLAPALLRAQAPDLILHNGKILTVDRNFSVAQAIAVTGDKISAVGSDADVLATAGPNTQKIDLKGREVIPGIIDTHRHSYNYAESDYAGDFTPDQLKRYPLDWSGVRTKDDVLAQLRDQMTKYHFKPGEWIYFNNRVSFMGPGNAQTDTFAKVLYDDLNQWELDKVTPDNPIMMTLGIPDFNGFLVNKKAMDWLMSTHGDFVRQYGRYWVDASGRPDGHLEPPASRIILPFSYDRDPAILAQMYEWDMQEHTAMGMTTVVGRLPKETVDAYALLQKEGKLNWRIGWGDIESFGNVDLDHGNLKSLAAKIGKGPDGQQDDMIWMTGAGPTAVDGSTSRACTDQKRTGTYTAIDKWFPSGQCHLDIEYKGSPLRAAPLEKNYYKDYVMDMARDGVRYANTHTAGDRAIGLMLNTIQEAQQEYGPNSTKDWALDHCDMVNPKDFARIAKLHVIMSCYVNTSIRESPEIATAYGDKVANTFPSPLESMVKAGVRVVLESDTDSYIWQDFEEAITRKDRTGKVWAPQERLDRPTALKMFTTWAADYALKGDKLGSLEKGKLADIVVLDKDYLTIPGDDIHTLTPQLVIFNGKTVYVHSDFAKEYNLNPPGALISTYQDLIKRRKKTNNLGLGGG